MLRSVLPLGFLFAYTLIQAEPPKLDALFPAGGRRGETIEVEAIGKFNAWPTEIWTDHAGLAIAPAEKKRRLTISIAPDAETRPALVRLFDANGSSAAKTFVISDHPETRETEPNDNSTQAQELNATTTGIVVNGVLKKSDTDFFRIKLEKGQTLVARADAYSLGSLVDPFLTLLDPDGHEVALASDSHNLDPYFVYQAIQSGPHVLQIFAMAHPAATAIIFSGSDSAVYRLALSLGSPEPVKIQADHQEQKLADENGSRRMNAPVSVEGILSQKGEVDRYLFEAKKGSAWQFRVDAHRLGLPTDPVFALDRPNGALIKEVDDVKPTRDPAYQSSAMPQDGNYTIRIWDRFHRSGPAMRYRLSLTKTEPKLRVTIDKQNYLLENNGTAELKLKLDRKNGHDKSLVMKIDGLPAGVSLEDANATGKAKEATLVLRASMDAPSTNLPFRLRILEKTDGNATKDSFATRSFLDSKSRGDYLVNKTEWLHLTVKPKEPKKEKEAEKTKP